VKSRLLLGLLLICLLSASYRSSLQGQNQANQPVVRREVAVTFDDLPGVQRLQGQPCSSKAFADLNRKLIQGITAHRIPALGLVVESRLCEAQRAALPELLSLWLDAGLELGNHSFSHFDLNNTALETYKADVIRGETVTKKLLQKRGKELKYFRHPFLHAGKSLEVKRAFEKFISERGYKIAPVTIDNQEWVFADVYAKAKGRGNTKTAERIAAAYITYMEGIFEFFEKLSIEVVGYEVKQVLLLHVNPLNADYFEQLVQMMKKRGYAFISLDQALEDPAYGLPDHYAGPQGLSWLHRWAVSKGLKLREEPREPDFIATLYRSYLK
jgi:peptidoglycan-N-acetylglucosamine deacetylase